MKNAFIQLAYASRSGARPACSGAARRACGKILSMKLGLIRMYEVDDAMRGEHGCYMDMFSQMLAAGGWQWQDYDARAGALPQTAEECDGYLITGSRHAVYEDWPWLPPLMDCIRMLDEARAKLAGICFGHQAAACALGGRAAKSEKGWGAGRQTWRICGDAPWMRPKIDEISFLASHQDQVMELPPRAILLASSDFCPNAMYAVGDHIFCMQGHPEFAPEYSRALLLNRRDTMPPETWQRAMDSLEKPIQRSLCAEWLVNFFSNRPAAKNAEKGKF